MFLEVLGTQSPIKNKFSSPEFRINSNVLTPKTPHLNKVHIFVFYFGKVVLFLRFVEILK